MGKEKGRMHLLLQRTSLLLVYLTFIIWLLLSFWVWGVFTITQKGWSKCNILIKWNFHFQVVVQFLQFHQQSGKRSLGFFERQHLKNMGSLLFCCLPQIFKHTWGHMQAPRLLHTRQHLEIKTKWANELLSGTTKWSACVFLLLGCVCYTLGTPHF